MANWQQPSGYGYQGWNNQTPMAGANASLAQPIAPQATAQAPTQAYNSAPYYGQQAVAQPTQTYAYQQPAAPVYQQPVAQAPAGPHMGYAPPGVPQVQAPGVVPGVGQYGHVPPATGHLTSIPPAAQHPYPPSQHAQYAYTNTAASGYTTVVTSDRRSRSPDGGWSREDRSRRSVSSERDKRTGDRRHNRDRRSRSRERDRRRDSRGGSDDRHRGGSRDGDWDDYDSNSRDQYYDRGDRNYGRQARGNLVSVTDEYDDGQETFDARNYRGYRPDLRRQLDRKAPKKSAEVKQAEPQKSEPEEPAEDSGTSDIFKRLEAYKKKFNALKSSDKTEESSESAEGNKKDTTKSLDKKPSSSSRDTSQKSKQPDRRSDKSSSQSSSSARKPDHSSSSRKPDHSSSRKPSDISSRRPDHSSSRKPDQSPSRKPSESSSRKSDQSSSRKSDHSPARKPDNSSSRKSTDSPRRKSDQSSSKTSSNTSSRPPSKRPASGSDRRSPSKSASQQSSTQTSKDNDAKKRKMTTEVSVTIGDKADTTKQTEADAKAKKAEADAKVKKAEADAKVKKAEADAKAKKVEADAKAKKAEADAKAKKAEADAKAKKAEADAKAKKAEADAKAKKAEADAKAKQAADVKAQFMKRKQEQLQLELAKQREKILEKRKAEAEEKESPQKKPKLSETSAEKTDTDKTPDTSKHRPSTEENSEKRELPKIPLKKNIKEDRSPEVIVVEEETDKDSTNADKDKHESESETVVKTESKIDREEISEVLKMVFDGDEEMIEINIDTRETKACQEGAEGGMSEAMLVDGGGRLGKHPMSRIDEFVRGMRDPDEALVGLQYLTEVIHLKGNKPNLYRCYCCNCHMYGGNIIAHLTGQKHRFSYLERNYPSLYMKLHHNQNSRGQVHLECAKIEKDVGRQKVRCVESHLWTGQKKHERRIHLPDIKVISSSEPEPAEEPSQPSTLTEASNQTQPSSEPKTSSEPQASTSILEELSSPNEEGGIQVEHVCGVAAKQPEPSSSTKPDKPDSTAKQPDSTAKQSTSTAKEQESTAKQPESTAQQADVEDDDIQFVPEPTKAELLQKVVDAAVEKASPVAYHEGKHYVHFYKFIQNKADVPLLGLSEVVEISGFREGQGSRVQYVCKLCKVPRFMSSKAMFDHTQSLLHLENYLERHHPRKVDAYDDIEQDKGRKMAVDNAAQLAFMEDGREDLLIARLEFPATDATALKKPAAPAATKPVTKPAAKPAEKATPVQTKITTSAAASAESPVETAKEVDSKDIKVVLFDLLKGLDSIPIVGLNYITEIQNPSNVSRPSYQCKLCETNHSVNFINAHLTSSHHRTKFLRTNYPLLHSRTAGNKDLVNKYVKEIQGRYGRESVWVKTLVAKGPNGMPIYSEPVFVKGPWAPKPPPRSNIGPGGIPEEMVPVPQGAAPVVESIPVVEPVPAVESLPAVESVPSLKEKEVAKEVVKPAEVPSSSKPTPEFDRIIHGLDCTALLGLQYVTEIQHPKKTYPAKYECLLCHHVGNGTPLNTINILNHITARAHRMNYFRETHEDMYKQIISCRDSNAQNIVLAQHTKTVESTIGRGVINVTISNDLSYWEDDDREAKEVAGKETPSGSGQTDLPVTSSAGAPDTPSKTEAAKPVKAAEEPEPMSPPALTDTVKKLVLEPKTSTMVKDIMLKKDGAFSWEREYGKLVQRIEEGTIIWSDRQSRYKTAFNTPQNIYSVIGIQWVLEVQRTNVRMEPYYLCRLCEERIIWKKIENHVNGLRHRISYMGHCYPLMYQFICQKKFTNIAGLRVRIDLYEKEIVKKEGTSQQPQVLLELDASQAGPAKQTGAQFVPAAKQTGAQIAVSSVQSGVKGVKSHTASSAPGTSFVQTPTSTTTIPVRVTTKYGGVPGTSQPVTRPTFTQPPVSAQPVSQATFKGQVYAPPVSSKPMPPVVSQPTAYTPASTRYPGTTYKAGAPSSSSSAHIPADSQGNRPIQSYSGPRPYATGTQQGRSTTTVPTSSTVTTKFGDKSQKDLEAISDDELSFDLIEISDDENFEDFDKPLTEKELKAVEEAYMKRLEEDEDILEELDLDDEERKVDKKLKSEEKEPFEPSGLVEVSVSLGPSVFEVTNSHQEQPRSSANIPGLTLIPEVKDEEEHEQEVKKSSTETDKSEKQTLVKNKSENIVGTKDTSKHSEKADDKKKSPSSKSKQHAKSHSEQIKTSAKKSSKDNEHKSVKPETSKAARDGKKTAKGKTPASPKPGTSKAGQSLSLLNKQPIVMLKRLTEQELKDNLSSYKAGKAIDMNLPSTSSAKPVIVKKSAVSKPPKTPEKPKPVIVKEVQASSTSVDKSAKGPHPSPSPKKHDKKEKQDQQPSKTHSDKKSDKPSSKTDDKKDSARSSEKYDKKRKPESAEQRHKSDKESLRSPRSRDSDKKHRPDDKRHQQSNSPSVDKSDKVSRHIKSSKTSDKKDSTQSSKKSDKKDSTTSSKTSDRKESISNSKTSHKTDSTSSSKQNEKTSKQEKPDQKQSKTLSGDEGGDKPDTKTNAVEVLVELGEEEEEQGGAEDFESFMAQFGDDFVTVDEFEDEPNSPMEIDVAVIIDELEPSDTEDASQISEMEPKKKLSNEAEPSKESNMASSKTSNIKAESKLSKKTSGETEPRQKASEKADASQTDEAKDTDKSSAETGSPGSKKLKGKELLSASSMKTILKSVIAESVPVRRPSEKHESTQRKKTSETCEVSLSMEPKIVIEPIKKQNEETKSALGKKHSKDTESALIEKANEETKLLSEKNVSMKTESASSEKLSVTIECELIDNPNNDNLSLDKQSSKETSVEQATASENTQANAEQRLNDTTIRKTDVEETILHINTEEIPSTTSQVRLAEDANLEQKKQPSSLEKTQESKDTPAIQQPKIVISVETEDGAAKFENKEDFNAEKTESESTNDIQQKDSDNKTVIECVVDSTIEKDSNESTCETEETSKVTATVEIEMSQEDEVKKTVIECVVGNTNEKDITEESSCETDEASKETVTVDVEAEMSQEVEIAVSIESDKSDNKDMTESGEDADDDFSELVCVDEFEDDEEEEFTVVDEADNLKDQEETFITIDSKTSDSNDENNQSYVSIGVSQSDNDQMENLADDNDDDDDGDDVEGFEEFTTVDDIEDEPDGGPEGQVTDEATEETLDTSSSLKDGDSKAKQKEDFRPYCHWHPFEKSEHQISVDVDIATEEGADCGSTGQEFTTLDDIDDTLDGGAEAKKKDYQPYCKWHPFEKAEHPISVDVDIAMEEEADRSSPAKTDSGNVDSGKVAGETTPGKVRVEVELATSPDKTAAARKSGVKASSTASGSKSSGTGGKSSRSPAVSKARSTGAGKKQAKKPGSDSHKADDAKKSSSEMSATTPHSSRHSSNEGSRHSSSEGHSRSGGHVHSSSTSESSRRSYESSSRGGECSSGETNRRADDSFSRGSSEYYLGKRWRPTELSQSYARSRVNRQGDRSGGERRSRSRSPRDDRCQVSVEFD